MREAVLPRRSRLHDQPAADGHLEAVRQRLVGRLAGERYVGEREVLAAHGRDAQGASRRLRQAVEPAVDHRAHPQGHVGAGRGHQRLVRAAWVRFDEVAYELLDEERVAAGAPVDGRHKLGRRRRAEPGRGQGTRLHLGQAGEHRALEPPLAPQVAEQRVQRGIGLGALVAQRAGHEQRVSRQCPDGVREHSERRAVGQVQVLHDQQDGRLPRGGCDRGGHRLEQAVASVARLALRRRGVGVELGQQASQLAGHPRGKRARGGGDEGPERLAEGRERRHALLDAAAGEHRGAGGAHLFGKLGEQPRLAAAGLAVDGHDGRGSGARTAPGDPQHGERLVPADERRLGAVGQRLRQRQRSGVRLLAVPLGAELLDQRARLAGRRHAQVTLQDGAERLVGGHRRRPVPAQCQPPHQHPGGVLGHGLELEPSARVRHGRLQVAGRLGRLPERPEQLAGALALRLARLEDPVVVEVDEQLGPIQRQCVGVMDVDPDLSALDETDALALGDDVSGGGLSQLATQSGQRRPQTRAGAALEHVRPEHRRHPGARMQPRVIREPREQRPRPTARDDTQRPSLQLEAKLAEETDPQHLAATLTAATRRLGRAGRTASSSTQRASPPG